MFGVVAGIITCSGAPGAASSMHFCLLRRAWGGISYAFLPAPVSLRQQIYFYLLRCPGAASSMHFDLLRRSWGSIFYKFLLALAPLGQYLPYIFTCSGDPEAASSIHFYLLRRPCLCIRMHNKHRNTQQGECKQRLEQTQFKKEERGRASS